MTVDGRPFSVYKFRTMVEDAEAETGPVWAVDGDPRRTKLGAFLRKYNLDELPQLLNIIKGDMSLVGPRPERPSFVHEFKNHIPNYMLRHRVRSGLTGWAQIHGWRGNSSLEKRIEFDLYYIENWSLLLDLKILLHPLPRLWTDARLLIAPTKDQEMPRTLVTGGAGFIGSHLCDYLLEKGMEVICMDNLLTGDRREHRPHPHADSSSSSTT